VKSLYLLKISKHKLEIFICAINQKDVWSCLYEIWWHVNLW